MKRSARVVLLCLVPATAACTHGEPYAVARWDASVPFDGGTPVRLTYSPGVDESASWLPDGSGILYSTRRLDRTDNDECLALLPPDGGRAIGRYCDEAVAQRDSTNTYLHAAVGPGDSVAFVRTGYRFGNPNPVSVDLWVGRLAHLGAARRVATLPYTLPGAQTHLDASQIRWLDPRTLVFRGDFAGNVCLIEGPQCPVIFVRSGRGLVLVPLDDPGARRVLPGTLVASSVALGRDRDEIYLTQGGDSRVYRMAVSTGIMAAVADVGAGEIVRDLQVAGRRAVALVGGAVTFEYRVTVGFVQLDLGGVLVMLDLDTGEVIPLGPPGMRVLRPALSPDGTRVVVEEGGDLWLYRLP